MLQRLKCLLLAYANASPPSVGRAEFYALKEKLLKRYGQRDGIDMQVIKKKCWGERFRKCGPDCRRCGGTGIYHIKWIYLERWKWCGRVFHRPVGTTYTQPITTQINGYIKHPNYGKASAEAALWLCLLCGQWKLLAQLMRYGMYYGWYGWPLLNIQRATFLASMHWRIRHQERGVWTSCDGDEEIPF